MNIGRILRRAITPLLRRNQQLMAGYVYLRGLKSIMAKPRMTTRGYFLVGNDDMIEGRYEPIETATIEKLLDSTDIFINIGANTGYYCAMAISRGIYTVAFEPVHQNLSMLYSTISANKWNNSIEVYPIAASSSIGLSDIFGYGTGASLSRGSNNPDYLSTLVPTNTIDNILGDRFNGKRMLIVIDAEGAEHDILQGSTKLLNSTPKPYCVVEVAPNENTKDNQSAEQRYIETFQLMWRLGYKSTTIEDNPMPVDHDTLKKRLSKEIQLPHNILFSPE